MELSAFVTFSSAPLLVQILFSDVTFPVLPTVLTLLKIQHLHVAFHTVFAAWLFPLPSSCPLFLSLSNQLQLIYVQWVIGVPFSLNALTCEPHGGRIAQCPMWGTKDRSWHWLYYEILVEKSNAYQCYAGKYLPSCIRKFKTLHFDVLI